MSYLRKMISRQVEVKLVDVFTSDPFQGNQIAVIPYGETISDEEKLSIVGELNTGKAAFIGDSSDGKSDFKIVVFTSDGEINADYQSLIATAHVMISEKKVTLKDTATNILTIETRNGVFPLIVHSKKDDDQRLMVMMNLEEKAEFRRVDCDTTMVADALGLNPEDIRSDIMMQAVKMNHWSLIVPIKHIESYVKMVFNRIKLLNLASENNIEYICLINLEKTETENRIHTQILRPSFDSNEIEDRITGESIPGVSAFLFEHELLPLKGSKLITSYTQNLRNGRTGEIFIEMDIINDFIKELCIGGHAVIVLDGKLRLIPDY